MLQHGRFDESRMAGIEAALRPYAWRRMSSRAVARRLVEELDGEAVVPDDPRAEMVERALAACRWRGLTIAGVARQAATSLEVWHTSRRRLDAELARVLGDDG
jgi:hypothetical protein